MGICFVSGGTHIGTEQGYATILRDHCIRGFEVAVVFARMDGFIETACLRVLVGEVPAFAPRPSAENPVLKQ